MTLHEAIKKVLKENGRPLKPIEIASILNDSKIYQKGDKSRIKSSQISARVNKYPSCFFKENGLIYLNNWDSSLKKTNEIMPKHTIKIRVDSKVTDGDIEEKLLAAGNFRQYNDLDSITLSKNGFYCLRLKENSKLPDRYQLILDKRKFKYLYIGKAEGQNLGERLDQEIEHKGPGTFFRSIGCVLEYLPIKGHLKGHSNQNNYKFSTTDTAEIVEWLISNIEISIVEYNSSFEIEKEFINKYCPLLNYNHNPMKLQELKEDKDNCRKIARG